VRFHLAQGCWEDGLKTYLPTIGCIPTETLNTRPPPLGSTQAWARDRKAFVALVCRTIAGAAIFGRASPVESLEDSRVVLPSGGARVPPEGGMFMRTTVNTKHSTPKLIHSIKKTRKKSWGKITNVENNKTQNPKWTQQKKININQIRLYGID